MTSHIVCDPCCFYPVYQLATASAFCLFFFNDTATTEIYTLSLHDALPISASSSRECRPRGSRRSGRPARRCRRRDRKSTRLNSSHGYISYAVFCLKKKKQKKEFARVSNVSATLCCIFHYNDRLGTRHDSCA